MNEEERLIESQFRDYDAKIRPVKLNDSVVEVALDYWFVSLLDIVSDLVCLFACLCVYLRGRVVVQQLMWLCKCKINYTCL